MAGSLAFRTAIVLSGWLAETVGLRGSFLLTGLCIDRLGQRPTFTAGLAGFGLVYLLYFLAPLLPSFVATQVLRGAAFAAYTATALTLAIALAPPEARGGAAGLFTFAQGLAQISGNWVGGPLAATPGFHGLFALAASSVLCGATYSALRLGRSRQAERTW